MKPRLGVLVVLGFVSAAAAYAYSAIISIEELVAKAPVVALVRVVSIREVRTAHGVETHAQATVLESWKGSLPGQIEYIASPGWYSCDTSTARIGEMIVLFAERDEDAGMYRIAHFGRGRMQVGLVRGTLHAAIDEVTFPAGMVTREPNFPHREVVSLSDLKKLFNRS